jgi:hypothetical protein
MGVWKKLVIQSLIIGSGVKIVPIQITAVIFIESVGNGEFYCRRRLR